MPLVEVSPHWECEMCGLAVGWVEDDLPEGEEEVGLPSGWVRMDMRMKGPNPALLQYRHALDAMVAQTAQMFVSEGAELEKAHIDRAREIVEQQSVPPVATVIVIDVSYCLCHECRPYLVNIEIMDFGEPPEEPAEPEKPVVVPVVVPVDAGS